MRLNLILGAAAFGVAGVLSTGQARAQSEAEPGTPVVVELFTSQGCSACPPADELLHKLAARDDVIALALHVDYWDYIGWKDRFALPGHTRRQKGYAKAAGRRMIYTPQMIINGVDHVVGNHPMDVSDLIALHEARSRPVALELETAGGKTILTLRATGEVSGEIQVMLVDYDPEATVEITRGENAGRTISYANIVESWQELGVWDGSAEFRTELPEVSSAAILVQKAGYGPMLAARNLP
ncbi:MAG: DUF1223 domain-containing protein [Marinovum algicola]|jgi:hypothetical protein|uniref:DUF1223 domain-containing protein n=1 Tax=Marinovum algicola TaxID=42444 RepID=A0A975W7F1_9RHOB|nr:MULTISPECIES: DUF1223 domain-containing protein [Marinovum]AKO96520.1 putative secreted protein [Marinovum algicola DG 898]MDD9738992.1 DUF1223 domain-containing protein [Marinovum sp. SP66]MDD9745872.1 DUF1223 domain-containing protein [Marinovum sp. PR37]SEI84000.1 hypothetical protein SAMN04487940_102167 [Marinovum algicola]SLN15649.1 hypothetical protein MAA5396_00347 [Marinovum algicola]